MNKSSIGILDFLVLSQKIHENFNIRTSLISLFLRRQVKTLVEASNILYFIGKLSIRTLTSIKY